MEEDTIARLQALAHSQRLAIFRLLVRRYPDEVPAGEIGEVLSIRPSTLSAYLKSLQQADLVTQSRQGTSLRYSVLLPKLQETLDYLLLDCCRGRPDVCASGHRVLEAPTTQEADRKLNVLFVCSGNSSRSIIAEALLRHLAGDRFNAFSAGTRPRGEINQGTIALLKQEGIDTKPLHSKSLAEFQAAEAPAMDIILSVCDHAANEGLGAMAGQPLGSHWSTPSTTSLATSREGDGNAFERIHDLLRARIERLIALPLDTFDALTLQATIDEIGRVPLDQAG